MSHSVSGVWKYWDSITIKLWYTLTSLLFINRGLLKTVKFGVACWKQNGQIMGTMTYVIWNTTVIIIQSAPSSYPHFVSCTQSEAVSLSRKKAAHCTFHFRTLVNFSGFISFYRRHFHTIARNGWSTIDQRGS